MGLTQHDVHSHMRDPILDGSCNLFCIESNPYRSFHSHGGHRMTPSAHAHVIRWRQ